MDLETVIPVKEGINLMQKAGHPPLRYLSSNEI